MNILKMLILMAGFTLLAACGKNPADKFIGEWVDPNPPEIKKKEGWRSRDPDPLDVIIKATDSANKVEVTYTMFQKEKNGL